jgi:hypothetical protein
MIGELDRMLADMQRRQVSVAAGSAPVPVIAPPSEPAPAPPPIERQRVFTLQQVLWTDEGLKTAIKFAMIDLPIETAKRALAAGAVLPLGDPRVGNIHDDWGNTGIRAHGPTLLPLAAHECRDLDEPIEEAAA